MAIKRDKLDDIFSKLIRERAGWVCEVETCQGDYEHRPQGLHASHLWGRAARSTRWHPDNAFAHCYGCHQKLGSNPVAFYDWALKQLGPVRFDELRLRANTPRKYTKAEREEMYQHYKQEFEAMRQKRMAGITGRLEFVAYD